MSKFAKAALGSLEDIVDAFESAMAVQGRARLHDFLPDRSAPDFLSVLQELVRVDMELRSSVAAVSSLEDYRHDFPELFESPAILEPLAYEEFRLRQRAQQPADAQDFARRYGIDPSGWGSSESGRSFESSGSTRPNQEPEILSPGSCLLDFQIMGQLGRGAFSRVYLARQESLAGRLVALKVSSARLQEADRLARLQHTNIVPIHSVHTVGRRSVICMPYFGAATLRHVMDALSKNQDSASSGLELLSTVSALDEQTLTSFSVPGSPKIDITASGIPPTTVSQPGRCLLSGLDHERASLWIVHQLADGLAHAHARGIQHRDLKPANVLLTEDGQPMILDFNLAYESAAQPGQDVIVGGTLPYMSPEQIASIDSLRPVDDRSDLFSLGVILFELLTGELPFPAAGVSVRQMIDLRWAGPPCTRQRNVRLSVDADSIVRKCLMPSPEDRFRSAAELMEDLDCQLHDFPLRHARNRSLSERSAKWIRRHPKITSASGILTLSFVTIACLLVMGLNLNERFRRSQAIQSFLQFQADVPKVRSEAFATVLGDTLRQDAARQLRALLGRYTTTILPSWHDAPDFCRLPAREQQELGDTLQELQFLLGRIEHELTSATEPQTTAGDVRSVPAAPNHNPSDLDQYQTAMRLVMQRDFRAACQILQPLCREDPDNRATTFLYGISLRGIQDLKHAETVFSICIALSPATSQNWYQRGVCRLAILDYPGAIDDFSQVLELQPGLTAALVSRGIAYRDNRQPQEALRDLSLAIRLGFPETRVYFVRASVHHLLGNTAAEALDLQTGLSLQPTDPRSWVARGLRLLPADPAGALADFESARDADPASHDAFRNISMVLSEYLNRAEESIAVLTAATECHPGDAFLWAGRGVLHARSGRRELALQDAARAEQLSNEPMIKYMTACIYSLGLQTTPGDSDKALALLADSLRLDIRLADLARNDHDLDPIRQTSGFQDLMTAAGILERGRPSDADTGQRASVSPAAAKP